MVKGLSKHPSWGQQVIATCEVFFSEKKRKKRKWWALGRISIDVIACLCTKTCYPNRPVNSLKINIRTHEQILPLSSSHSFRNKQWRGETINYVHNKGETETSSKAPMVWLLCALLSLTKTSWLIYPNKLLFSVRLCPFYFSTLSHHQTSSEAPQGKLAALTDSCLSCWSKNNNTKDSSNKPVCGCMFPRLSVRSQSLVHLCKSVHRCLARGKNIWIFTKEQIPNAHLNSPRALCVLSFPSGLSDPIVQLDPPPPSTFARITDWEEGREMETKRKIDN